MVDSDDNNLCFKFWNFSIKFFLLLGFTKELVFGSSTFCMFLDGSRFFKEPVCHAFAAFTIQRLHFVRVRNDKFSSYKLFFRVTEFGYLLRVFFTFLSPFLKSANKEQWHFAGLHF